MTMRLRPDLVLVQLPPSEAIRRSGSVYAVARYAPAATLGVVRQIGAQVVETLSVGDIVVFGSEVGEDVTVDEWPHLLIRAVDLDAVVERE